MRLISLLLVVLVVAWLAYSQLGGSGAGGPGSPPTYQQAQKKAAHVEVQVQDKFAEQADQLTRLEQGEAAEAP